MSSSTRPPQRRAVARAAFNRVFAPLPPQLSSLLRSNLLTYSMPDRVNDVIVRYSIASNLTPNFSTPVSIPAHSLLRFYNHTPLHRVGTTPATIEFFLLHVCQHANAQQQPPCAIPGTVPRFLPMPHALFSDFLHYELGEWGFTDFGSYTPERRWQVINSRPPRDMLRARHRVLRNFGYDVRAFMQLDMLLLPLITHAHSQLLIVSPRTRTIEFFCSGPNLSYPTACEFVSFACRLLESILGAASDIRNSHPFRAADWFFRTDRAASQGPTSNCGVHTMLSAMERVFGYEYELDAERSLVEGRDMCAARRWIAALLLSGGFTPVDQQGGTDFEFPVLRGNEDGVEPDVSGGWRAIAREDLIMKFLREAALEKSMNPNGVNTMN